MCTLAVAFRRYPGYPLIVAANRDEQLTRPSAPPRVWPSAMPFLAPLDEVAGGSWLGINATGMFVGITNRFGVKNDAQRESRGRLVLEALARPSASALHDSLSRLAPSRFNAFHLFYADARHAFITWSDGSTVQQSALAPGLHVVTERSLGGDDHARTELVQSGWPNDDRLPTVQELAALMSVHRDGDPLGSTCVHAPAFNYGTRSSLLLYLADEPHRSRLYWAEGKPCEAPHHDRSVWLQELSAARIP